MKVNRYEQRALIAALEKEIARQIEKYSPKDYMFFAESGSAVLFGTEIVLNIAACGSFAMCYHELAHEFNDANVVFTDAAFSDAFIRSDRARADAECKSGVVFNGMQYDWYIGVQYSPAYDFLVHSQHRTDDSAAPEGMIKVDFGDWVDTTHYRRPRKQTHGIFEIDELYCQYAALSDMYPDEARYAENADIALKALRKHFSGSFQSNKYEYYCMYNNENMMIGEQPAVNKCPYNRKV